MKCGLAWKGGGFDGARVGAYARAIDADDAARSGRPACVTGLLTEASLQGLRRPSFLPAGASPAPLLFALALTGALASGCGEDAAPAPGAGESAAPQMQFVVNEALLGAPYDAEAFDITLRPPVGWAALPEDQLAAVAAAGRSQAATQPTTQPGELSAEPLAVFVGPADEAGRPATLMVTAVDAAVAAETPDLLRQQYEENVKAGDFRVGEVPVGLYNMVTPQLVTWKILVRPDAPRDGRVLQLDYVASRAGYAKVAKQIESSIGSLRPSASPPASGPPDP